MEGGDERERDGWDRRIRWEAEYNRKGERTQFHGVFLKQCVPEPHEASKRVPGGIHKSI